MILVISDESLWFNVLFLMNQHIFFVLLKLTGVGTALVLNSIVFVTSYQVSLTNLAICVAWLLIIVPLFRLAASIGVLRIR